MTKQELGKIMDDADKTVEAILGGKESIFLNIGRIMKDQKTILELSRMVIEMQHELDWLNVNSINFEARVKESWDHLSPNNYDSKSAAWNALHDLQERRSRVEKLLTKMGIEV